MKSDLPEEIRDLINTLQASEKGLVNGVGIESFTKALAELDECVDEYPDHKKFLEKIKFSHIRRIMDILQQNRPDIDFAQWLSLILFLFGTYKSITKQIVKDNPVIKAYLTELLSL